MGVLHPSSSLCSPTKSPGAQQAPRLIPGHRALMNCLRCCSLESAFRVQWSRDPLSPAQCVRERRVQMSHAGCTTRPRHPSLLVEVLLLTTDKHLRVLIVVGPHAAPCDARVIYVCCSVFRPQPVSDTEMSLSGDKGASCRKVISSGYKMFTLLSSLHIAGGSVEQVPWGPSLGGVMCKGMEKVTPPGTSFSVSQLPCPLSMMGHVWCVSDHGASFTPQQEFSWDGGFHQSTSLNHCLPL